jgi:hypothetical protein
MQTQVKYQTETIILSDGNRTRRINSHTPILPPKERERRKRQAEQQLFDVFSKYAVVQS